MDHKQAVARYGEIRNGFWYGESLWCRTLGVPPDIASGWINSATGKPTTKIYCNRDMVDPLLHALLMIRDEGLLPELKTFDGCFNVRDVRGEPGVASAHSWGMAIDINAAENALGTAGNLSPKIVRCFTEQGFNWGGHFKRLDPMHFSLLHF